jgi:ABC-type enterochelin transport system substrate-binding protein
MASLSDQLAAVYVKEDELRRQIADIKASVNKVAKEKKVLTDLLLAEGMLDELAPQRSHAACMEVGVEEADEQTADVNEMGSGMWDGMRGVRLGGGHSE